jgi:hypothetical protein
MPRLHLVLSLALACAAAPLAAACSGGSTGGGTGGGYGMDYRNIQPDYQDEAQARTAAGSTGGAGGYVVALQKSKAPIGVWTDRLKDLSGKMPFVRLEDDAAQKFATQWKITSFPAVGICDQFGNLLDVTSGQLSAGKISGMIERLPEARQTTITALGLNLRKAIDAANAGKTADALATIAKIQAFNGYAWCAKAEELRQVLIERGFQALAAAKEKPSTEIRTALVALRRDYAGTSVADEATETLKTLK